MGDGDAGKQRWLLTSLEHCVGWRTIQKLSELGEFNCRDVIDPVKVQWSPGGSLTLAFHSLTTSYVTNYGNCYDIAVHVDNLVAGDDPVEVEASLIRVSRTAGGTSYTPSNRSAWPAPDNPITVVLKADGLVGKACQINTLHLTVKLQVFSLRKPGVPLSAPVVSGLESMRKTATLCDVVLTVDGVDFYAHRAVLAANSVVFAKMFSGPFKEGKMEEIGDKDESSRAVQVDVKDTTTEAFDAFLQLMYTGEVDDWQGLEVELLVLADRYMITHVKDACERRLLKMDTGTALGILRHAEKTVISSDVRVRAVQSVLRGWERLVILPQWKDFQEDFPVFADTLRAAQALMGPLQ